MIADELAAYLMVNAMTMDNKFCWNDDLKTSNEHIRQIATYVTSNQRAELRLKS